MLSMVISFNFFKMNIYTNHLEMNVELKHREELLTKIRFYVKIHNLGKLLNHTLLQRFWVNEIHI